MRKIVLAFLIILVSVSVSFGASTKISELTGTQTLTDDDLFLVSTYATGSYTSKYITTQYVKSALGIMTIANDTLWDAAGDLVYGTGANTGSRLAIGAPYALLMTNAGATAPAWTYTLGAPGTRLTKIWATDLEITNPPTINGAALTTILQPLDGELTALAGLTSAANAIPYFTGSGTAGVISSSANMVSLLESEDYATALGLLGGQSLNDDLTALSSGGTANCIWGEKSDSSGIECKTTFNAQFDDTAAQFKSATASKGTLKFLLSGSTDAALMTVTSVQTEARTLTLPDATATLTYTVASGSIALATSEIASAACQTITEDSVNSAAAPGVATTDVITFTPNATIKAVTGYAPLTAGGLTINAYPTAGHVNFDVCNWSAAAITPGAVTLNWRVVR